MMVELQAPPLGLYVHLPWCIRKCPYCDFNSHPLRGELPAAAYLKALLEDLDRECPRVAGRAVHSIYLGGGTPSLFSAGQIETLLSGIRSRLPLAPAVEVTLEANPGAIEHDGFEAYREAGVNRVSLGVQSFDDRLLRAIGRIHGRREVEAALSGLRDAGMENFNVDLMYGLPGQNLQQAVADVRMALSAEPAHLSHYQLTLEPNTAFAANPPPDLPGEEDCWEMQAACEEELAGAGFRQYEVSGWAKRGRECRHNLNYWQFGDYLGIGAGAHAKLTLVEAGEVRRSVRVRHPTRYLSGEVVAEDRVVGGTDLQFEYFLNVLRLPTGFGRMHFGQRTGLPWEWVQTRVDEAVARGLLESWAGGFRPTPLGWRFGNDLQALFLP